MTDLIGRFVPLSELKDLFDDNLFRTYAAIPWAGGFLVLRKLCLIAAVSENNVIGQNSSIPWDCSPDRQFFKHLTLNGTVIMGRKTWDSLPIKPLSGRLNVLVSKTNPLPKAIEDSKGEFPTWLIGGHGVYKEGIDLVDHMILTRIPKKIYGENRVFFPKFNKKDWIRTSRLEVGELDLQTVYVDVYTRATKPPVTSDGLA